MAVAAAAVKAVSYTNLDVYKRQVYEYVWNESRRRFDPGSVGTGLPVWSLQPNALKNSSFTNVQEFPDLSIEHGTVPPPVALAVAMHKWQWKQEARGWDE